MCYIASSLVVGPRILRRHIKFIYLIKFNKVIYGLYTSMIMLDLQKAFDTIDHSFFYFINRSTIDVKYIEWLKSYLTERKH